MAAAAKGTNTVVNESNEVAYKKSIHSAKTQSMSDTCYLKPGGPPATGDFMNSAPSSRIDAKATTNTNIQDSPIAVKPTHWGPLSDPEHAGENGGKDNGQKYRWEAEASDASKTVEAEGEGMVRTDDPTHQNHKNTTGKVEANQDEPTALSKKEFAEKVCKITWFKGLEQGTGRELGWAGKQKVGEPKYLDVWMESTVMFFSEREDTRDGAKDKDPKCTVPDSPHTQWHANWKIFPTFFIGDEKHKDGSEFFELPATLAVSETLVKALGMKKGDDEGAQDYGHEWGADRGIENDGKRDHADQHGYDAPGGLQMGGSPVPVVLTGPNDPGGAAKAKERFEHYKKAYGGEPGKKKKTEITPLKLSPLDMKRIFLYFCWWLKPPKMAVTATSCGASRNAEIGVYPKQPLKVGIDLEWLNNKGKKLQKHIADTPRRKKLAHDQAKRAQRIAGNQAEEAGRQAGIAEGKRDARHKNDQQNRRKFQEQADKARAKEAEYLAKFEKAEKNFKQCVAALSTTKRIFGIAEKIARVAGEPLKIRFLDGFGIEVVTGYRQCEDKKSAKSSKYYTVSMIRQFWELTLEAEPLIGIDYTVNFSLLNFLLPFAGQFIGKVLRRAGVVRVDIFFGVAFGVTLGVTIKKDQHDEIGGEFKAQFDLNMSMGIAAGFAGIDAVRFTARIPANAGITVSGADDKSPPGSMIVGQLSCSISCHFDVVVLPDTWFEFEAWSASPRSLKRSITGEPFTILQQPA